MYKSQSSMGPSRPRIYLKRDIDPTQQPRDETWMGEGGLGYAFNNISWSRFLAPSLEDSSTRAPSIAEIIHIWESVYVGLLCWPFIHSFHKNLLKVAAISLLYSSHEKQSSALPRVDALKATCTYWGQNKWTSQYLFNFLNYRKHY